MNPFQFSNGISTILTSDVHTRDTEQCPAEIPQYTHVSQNSCSNTYRAGKKQNLDKWIHHVLKSIKRILRNNNLPLIHEIHQHEIRLPPILPLTQRGLRAYTPRARRGISPRRVLPIRYQNAGIEELKAAEFP